MKKGLITAGKVIAFFMIWVILTGMTEVPCEDAVLWRFYAELLPFLCMVGASFVFWLIEKQSIPIVSWKKSGDKTFLGKNLLFGIGAGVLWLGIPLGILYLCGVIRFVSYEPVKSLPIWTISCFLNVVMQELLVRGYIYQLIKKKHNTIAAVIVTTLIFTLLHGGAFEEGLVPVLCVITMSLGMCAVLEYTQSLVAPILMHFIWNYFGAIIFNSLLLADDYPHWFITEFTGNALISGGNCLMEGSFVVLIINILLICVVSYTAKRRR